VSSVVRRVSTRRSLRSSVLSVLKLERHGGHREFSFWLRPTAALCPHRGPVLNLGRPACNCPVRAGPPRARRKRSGGHSSPLRVRLGTMGHHSQASFSYIGPNTVRVRLYIGPARNRQAYHFNCAVHPFPLTPCHLLTAFLFNNIPALSG